MQLSTSGPGLLTLRYNLEADMSRLRVGAEVVPGPVDGLWKHTCFEAFILPGESRCYYEFNFSPSTQWAAYGFSGYRSGMRVATEIGAPRIKVRSSAENSTGLVRCSSKPASRARSRSLGASALPGRRRNASTE